MLQRTTYLLLFIFLTWLALATRHHPQWFPSLVAEYGGDTIWAGMFLFFLRAFLLRPALWKLALFAYALGVITETLQLYHAPWIESFRATRIGGLLIGHGFLWSDLLCYAIGIVFAFILITILERTIFRRAA